MHFNVVYTCQHTHKLRILPTNNFSVNMPFTISNNCLLFYEPSHFSIPFSFYYSTTLWFLSSMPLFYCANFRPFPQILTSSNIYWIYLILLDIQCFFFEIFFSYIHAIYTHVYVWSFHDNSYLIPSWKKEELKQALCKDVSFKCSRMLHWTTTINY